MSDISDEVRALVHQRVSTMDHVEVLMRLYEAEGGSLPLREIERSSRLGPMTVARCATDLVHAELATQDDATQSYAFSPRRPGDRKAVAELAALYHQRPVTLVKLVYAQPPAPVRSFADSFRLRDKPDES